MEKDIIFKCLLFSLRREYLKNQEALNSLKQYVELSDEKIEDFCFSVLKPFFGGSPQLMITLIEKQNALNKFMDFLLEKLGWDIYSPVDSQLVKKGDNYYVKSSDVIITIKEDCREKFDEQISSIFNSLFITSINSYKEFGNYAFSTTPSDLIFYISDNCHYPILSCVYSSKDDTISIGSSGINLSSDFIQEIFETTIPMSMLSNYHQSIIDANPIFDKNFEIVGDSNKSNSAHFRIIEDEQKILLKRKHIL